jgi:hypothetical protein
MALELEVIMIIIGIIITSVVLAIAFIKLGELLDEDKEVKDDS